MQDAPRLYMLPDAALCAGASLPAEASQARYLGAVLRLGSGDPVRLFNARDGEWLARIESAGRRGAAALLVEARLRPPVPEPGPVLLFAPVKRDATDLIVRSAAEMGVAGLRPVITERTIAARVNEARMALIATEAAEQSERLSVPWIAPPRPLAAVLSEWDPALGLLACIERLGPAGNATGDLERDAALPAGLLIGPEGGFTTRELDALRRRPFVTAISLGPRILRAETAAIAGLSCLQSARERWGLWRTAPQLGFHLSPGSEPTPLPPAKPAEPDVEPR